MTFRGIFVLGLVFLTLLCYTRNGRTTPQPGRELHMLWDWVKAERTRRHWTQMDLARHSGVAVRVIRAGEQGQRTTATPETLGKLAGVFELTIDELLSAALGGRSPTLAELRTLAAGASSAAQRFLAVLEEDYYTASDETWHTLTQVLQAMIARDRAKQAEERKQRTVEGARLDDSAGTVQAVSGSP